MRLYSSGGGGRPAWGGGKQTTPGELNGNFITPNNHFLFFINKQWKKESHVIISFIDVMSPLISSCPKIAASDWLPIWNVRSFLWNGKTAAIRFCGVSGGRLQEAGRYKKYKLHPGTCFEWTSPAFPQFKRYEKFADQRMKKEAFGWLMSQSLIIVASPSHFSTQAALQQGHRLKQQHSWLIINTASLIIVVPKLDHCPAYRK